MGLENIIAEKPTIPNKSAIIALLTDEVVFFELLAARANPSNAPIAHIPVKFVVSETLKPKI